MKYLYKSMTYEGLKIRSESDQNLTPESNQRPLRGRWFNPNDQALLIGSDQKLKTT